MLRIKKLHPAWGAKKILTIEPFSKLSSLKNEILKIF
jgi:hypothetical protein